MIVQTRSGRRGTVVDISPPHTPPELRRVFVRLWLDIGTRWPNRPPAKVIVAYAPEDVVEMSETPNGEWKTAPHDLTCARCAKTIWSRRKYYATSRIYCTWCANEVWGVSTRTDRAKKRA